MSPFVREAQEVYLALLLQDIHRADQTEDYDRRARLIYHALFLATQLGYPLGMYCDPACPEWPVVAVELPTGQVTWHMPAYARGWDGHSTPEKYRRIDRYAREVLAKVRWIT